jgi:hypothetical protein
VNFIAWHNGAIRSKIAGFTWLPKIPQCEDAAMISWRTVADFAWAPERYDPARSFQSAAARYLGASGGTPSPDGSVLPSTKKPGSSRGRVGTSRTRASTP